MSEGRGAAVAIFAKRPLAGFVKTRMCPALSPERAAAFYRVMLEDVLEETARAARSHGFSAFVAAHPPEALPEILAMAPAGVLGIPQRGPDLSHRLASAFRDLADRGYGPVVVRGSDSPGVRADEIARALSRLEHSDVVLGPDRDGGYHLVGLRRPVAGLFDHAMSTERVLDDTRARARSLGLHVALLEPGYDIDTPEDLGELREERRRSDTPCPRTVAFVTRHGLWPLGAAHGSGKD